MIDGCSIAFLCQPLGSIFSGPIIDHFGRRKALFLVNIPHLIAWLLLYYAWNVPTLLLANALLGIGTGIMEAPSITYIGERGVDPRSADDGHANDFTHVRCSSLGAALPWRRAALVCVGAPLLTMAMVLLVPETPIWLISKGRKKEALKSLCRLRGWASPEAVKDEFDKLLSYNETLSRCPLCANATDGEEKRCEHESSNAIARSISKIRYVLLKGDTLRPFTLVMAYFLFHTMSGLGPVKPNMINLCRAMAMKYDPKNLVVVVGVIYVMTSVISSITVKLIGKRKLVVTSMFATTLCSLALCVYAYALLEPSVFSYDPQTFPEKTSTVAMVLFLMLVFFTTMGIPWVLLSEVFPFRSRGMATGLAAAGSYVIMFLATKTNYDLELHAGLAGAFAVYTVFGLMGTVYMYLMLPETENKTLIEIEEFYKGKSRIFADDCFQPLARGSKNSFRIKRAVEQGEWEQYGDQIFCGLFAASSNLLFSINFDSEKLRSYSTVHMNVTVPANHFKTSLDFVLGMAFDPEFNPSLNPVAGASLVHKFHSDCVLALDIDSDSDPESVLDSQSQS
ncbi:Facilitated trehalose transporter Tret1 [Eumeta japonica]|uniref:Facilitated trehalose transporter Tret1 n=1 Tax=Eumeta variegata TaxID=151549 RepID=A0A4C2A8G0_EUMVA|nr:Facilitated trehalose transporter Tret1 [Eumeta japonica]